VYASSPPDRPSSTASADRSSAESCSIQRLPRWQPADLGSTVTNLAYGQPVGLRSIPGRLPNRPSFVEARFRPPRAPTHRTTVPPSPPTSRSESGCSVSRCATPGRCVRDRIVVPCREGSASRDGLDDGVALRPCPPDAGDIGHGPRPHWSDGRC
jgi:hypothetical protein